MTEWSAERQFVEARKLHLGTDAEEHCSRILGRSIASEPFRTVSHNLRDIRDRLDIVDDGRLSEQTRCRRIRRLLARLRRFAFEDLERRRVFAGNIDGRRTVNGQFNVRSCFFERGAESAMTLVVCFVQVEEGLSRPNRPCGEQHAFQYKVRPVLQKNTILETAWLVFACVTDNVFLFGRFLARDSPLLPYRKSGPASSLQPGTDHLLKDVALNWRVSAAGAVLRECLGLRGFALGKKNHKKLISRG